MNLTGYSGDENLEAPAQPFLCLPPLVTTPPPVQDSGAGRHSFSPKVQIVAACKLRQRKCSHGFSQVGVGRREFHSGLWRFDSRFFSVLVAHPCVDLPRSSCECSTNCRFTLPLAGIHFGAVNSVPPTFLLPFLLGLHLRV